MKKRKLFVVSDVHGYASLLKEALKKSGFDPENKEHLLICCGDYFDRGNENVEVLKFFERLKYKALIRGNHEDLLLKLLNSGKVQPHNYINGTMQTLNDFFGKYTINPVDDSIDFSGKTRTVDRIGDFISETVNYFETENYVFVHGWFVTNGDNAETRKNASNESWEKARKEKWTEMYIGEPPIKNKTLVCGHVPTFYAGKFDSSRKEGSSDIFFGNGFIALDAGTDITRQINVLVIEDNLLE